MANETTATIVANLGHGTRTEGVYHKTGRGRTGLGSVCLAKRVPRGQATVQVALIAANSLSVSSYSEAGAAEANQAMATVNAASFTPASYVVAMAPTDHAINRADPNLADVEKLIVSECEWLHDKALSNLLVGLFDNFTAISGTAGADLTPDTVLAAYGTLCAQVVGDPDVILYVDSKGARDLESWAWNTNSPAVNHPRVAQIVDLLAKAGFNKGSYLGTTHGKIHVYKDPGTSTFPTDSGDTVAGMFVPAAPGLNGMPLPPGLESMFSEIASSMPEGIELAPGLGIAYREDPCPMSSQVAAKVVEGEIMGGIPVKALYRAYDGKGLAVIDSWTSVAVVVVSADSGVGVRYSPT